MLKYRPSKGTLALFFQIICLVGAILILIAFAANQLHKMPHETAGYQLLNLIGGACLCVTAVHTLQYGFILLEGSWTVLSAYGLWKLRKARAGSVARELDRPHS
jgi:NADH:ubiquinone oxidoreductase subunit 2 (subunit N)